MLITYWSKIDNTHFLQHINTKQLQQNARNSVDESERSAHQNTGVAKIGEAEERTYSGQGDFSAVTHLTMYSVLSPVLSSYVFT